MATNRFPLDQLSRKLVLVPGEEDECSVTQEAAIVKGKIQVTLTFVIVGQQQKPLIQLYETKSGYDAAIDKATERWNHLEEDLKAAGRAAQHYYELKTGGKIGAHWLSTLTSAAVYEYYQTAQEDAGRVALLPSRINDDLSPMRWLVLRNGFDDEVPLNLDKLERAIHGIQMGAENLFSVARNLIDLEGDDWTEGGVQTQTLSHGGLGNSQDPMWQKLQAFYEELHNIVFDANMLWLNIAEDIRRDKKAPHGHIKNQAAMISAHIKRAQEFFAEFKEAQADSVLRYELGDINAIVESNSYMRERHESEISTGGDKKPAKGIFKLFNDLERMAADTQSLKRNVRNGMYNARGRE